MTKDLIIVALGVWVTLVPFLGFPSRWDTILLVVSGLLIVTLMFMLRRDFVRYVARLKRRHHEQDDNPFVEHIPTTSTPLPETQKIATADEENHVLRSDEENPHVPPPRPASPPPPPPPPAKLAHDAPTPKAKPKRASRKRASKKVAIDEADTTESE